MALFTLKYQAIDLSLTPTSLPPWLGITKRKPRKYSTEEYCRGRGGWKYGRIFVFFFPPLWLGMWSADPKNLLLS